MAIIHAAFSDVGVDTAKSRDAAIEAAIQQVKSLEATLTAKAGAGRAASLAALVQALHAAKAPVTQWLVDTGALEPTPEEGGEAGAAAPVKRVAGEITNREDAIRMMGKIAEFIRKSEPSSPVPILLERAQKLVGKDFIAILRNVAPDGLDQIERLKGPQEE
jgi:type VI secretion system protein ImpA